MKEDFGTQLENGSLRFVRDLPGPIDRVWEYLTDPVKRALWFCDGTMSETPGDSFVMAFNHDRLSHEPLPKRYAAMQGGIEMGARLVEIDPPHLLVFEGVDEDQQTRIELTEQGGRVQLLLIQSPTSDISELRDTAAGWHAHLGLLIDHISGRGPRGFWTDHEEAAEYYQNTLKPRP